MSKKNNTTEQTRKPRIPKQFLGAFKAGHRASAREFIDEELGYQLLNKIIDSNWEDKEAIQQLEYITRFNNEFHKNVIKKDDPKALHKTPEQVKDLYSRENARNRDIMSVDRKKRLDTVIQTDEGYVDALNDEDSFVPRSKQKAFLTQNRNLDNHEDVLIDIIDHYRAEEKKKVDDN